MKPQRAATPERLITFHTQLCDDDWHEAPDGLVDPGMMLHVPDAFPWHPAQFRGIEALRHFRAALDVISDGTFKISPAGHTGDERLVAIRCHEAATRNGQFLEWTSLWAYILTDNKVSETTVVYSVTSDDLSAFWCF